MAIFSIKQFCRELSTVEGLTWFWNPTVRGYSETGYKFCVITAVLWKRTGAFQDEVFYRKSLDAGLSLGLDDEDAMNIISAADGFLKHPNKFVTSERRFIRRELFKSLGLTEFINTPICRRVL